MPDQQCAIRKSFAQSELIMKLNGLLPGENFKILYTFFAYALMIGFNILMPVLGYVNLFTADPEERMDLVGNSFIYMEMLILVFKNWSLVVTPDLTKKMLNRWNEDIFNTEVDIDRHIINEAIRERRQGYILYFMFAVSAPSFLLLNIIFSAHDDLKLPIWLPMDIYNSTLRYTLANSITLGEAIIQSPWYNYDMKSKRSLMILIEKSRKPIKFTAGKIVDISLETFDLVS
ncbi:unnamed protein product [Phyllotreta striolata]|uniref:Uncharacterized protein n=1 Tax=Phyllotreta striolata TaxID=444603 RepID=A0A9N9XMG0_PHYSR|nr:unnamed protein product [Phyllotreta striolata]